MKVNIKQAIVLDSIFEMLVRSDRESVSSLSIKNMELLDEAFNGVIRKLSSNVFGELLRDIHFINSKNHDSIEEAEAELTKLKTKYGNLYKDYLGLSSFVIGLGDKSLNVRLVRYDYDDYRSMPEIPKKVVRTYKLYKSKCNVKFIRISLRRKLDKWRGDFKDFKKSLTWE